MRRTTNGQNVVGPLDLNITLRTCQPRPRLRQPGPCKLNIRASDFANLKAILRSPQFLRDEPQVAFAQGHGLYRGAKLQKRLNGIE